MEAAPSFVTRHHRPTLPWGEEGSNSFVHSCWQRMSDLLVFSDKYEIKPLADACLFHLSVMITPETAPLLLATADRFGLAMNFTISSRHHIKVPSVPVQPHAPTSLTQQVPQHAPRSNLHGALCNSRVCAHSCTELFAPRPFVGASLLARSSLLPHAYCGRREYAASAGRPGDSLLVLGCTCTELFTLARSSLPHPQGRKPPPELARRSLPPRECFTQFFDGLASSAAPRRVVNSTFGNSGSLP